MPEKVLLVMAEDSATGKPMAGALNLIGSDALFGRNWGCMYGSAIKNLHFELCYYQVCRQPVRQAPALAWPATSQHQLSDQQIAISILALSAC